MTSACALLLTTPVLRMSLFSNWQRDTSLLRHVCVCLCVSPLRAQNLFRQAMRSPLILFHVVPVVKKAQYELLSQNELGLQAAPGPGERAGLVGGGEDYSPRRMSKADSTLGYPTLPHLANPSNETPPGPMHPSRPTSAASSVGYSKKIVRKSSVQLRKGTVTQVSSYWLAALQGHMTSRMRAFTWFIEISQSVRFGRALMGRTRCNLWTFTNLQCFTELI